MSLTKRFQMIFFLLVGMVLLTLIAASLSEVEFQPGQPFFLSKEDQSLPVDQLDFKTWNLVGIWKVFGLIILWVILPLSFIYFVVSPEARKTVIRRAITLGFSAYALFILLRQCSQVAPDELFNIDKLAETALEAGEPIEANFSPQTTELIEWIANIFFVALLAILAWRIIQWWANRSKTVDQIAAQAVDALEDIRAGVDLKDRILQCYAEMNRLLMQRRGVHRPKAITAREFESELEQLGLPGEQVRTLTRLFEKARYGGNQLGPVEQQEAEECLRVIASAIGDRI